MNVRAHLICFLSLINHCPLLPDVLFLLNHFSYILLFFLLTCLWWEGELWSVTSSGLEHKFFSVILKPVQLGFLIHANYLIYYFIEFEYWYKQKTIEILKMQHLDIFYFGIAIATIQSSTLFRWALAYTLKKII